MNTTVRQPQLPPDSIEEALDDITARGVEAIQNAKARVDDTVTRATEFGSDVSDQARAATSSVDRYIRTSIRERPYTTLAVAGFIGFAYAVLRSR